MNNNNWIKDAIFYHIYPLGMLYALYKNDYKADPIPRLKKINDWIYHFKDLNINALYLGPLFESEYHGYETVDYNFVDRRLGGNEDLKELICNLHKHDIKVILDGVFNHCGRDFWAFKDLLLNKNNSPYKAWFHNVDFANNNVFNDGFSYTGWNNHLNLVKFNHNNNDLKEYLFNAVENWIKYFNIDGLRLDAADCIDIDFLSGLSRHCKNIKNDFWIMGEVIHGDYNKWANRETLDSVTNYECYKGLYSSHNDNNYFEIAYSLKRQFGVNGIYKNLTLYNFADNHDVDRISSTLKNQLHLYPLYILLYTMPGIPSIYYGSEIGMKGRRGINSDDELRPALSFDDLKNKGSINLNLLEIIKKLGIIRNDFPALKNGNYEELLVSHNHYLFKRTLENQKVIVAVNSQENNVDIELSNISDGKVLIDIFNNNEKFNIQDGKAKINLYPNWGRIMLLE